MQCPRCGGEEHETFRTKRSRTASDKVSPICDLRLQRCKECELVTYVECRLTHVAVYDPEVMRSKHVGIDEYNEVWLPRDETHPHQMRLFHD
jgi:uncharacterized Zn finger protein